MAAVKPTPDEAALVLRRVLAAASRAGVPEALVLEGQVALDALREEVESLEASLREAADWASDDRD